MSAAIIVFAKAPVPGLAKTRLAPALGADGAAALAVRLLAHAARQAASAGFDARELCVTPDADHPAFARAVQAHDFALTLQGDGDLGERMARATTRALERHAAVVLIGTDAPALDAARLDRARATLATHDAVFVPALDGGYALVGLRRPAPGLFYDIAWSTAEVMARTRAQGARLGLSLAELDPVADIDEPADLIHLPPHWRPHRRGVTP